jgi:hypothetical protein
MAFCSKLAFRVLLFVCELAISSWHVIPLRYFAGNLHFLPPEFEEKLATFVPKSKSLKSGLLETSQAIEQPRSH